MVWRQGPVEKPFVIHAVGHCSLHLHGRGLACKSQAAGQGFDIESAIGGLCSYIYRAENATITRYPRGVSRRRALAAAKESRSREDQCLRKWRMLIRRPGVSADIVADFLGSAKWNVVWERVQRDETPRGCKCSASQVCEKQSLRLPICLCHEEGRLNLAHVVEKV